MRPSREGTHLRCIGRYFKSQGDMVKYVPVSISNGKKGLSSLFETRNVVHDSYVGRWRFPSRNCCSVMCGVVAMCLVSNEGGHYTL